MSEPTRPEFHWPAAPASSTAGESDTATAEPIRVELPVDQSHAESDEADDEDE